MKKKRGQSGTGAAALVAIIAGIIILYILFLEPSDREKLLDESLSDDNGFNEDDEDKIISILLDEEPGRLDYLKGDEFEVDIPSFNLYKTTGSAEIETFNDFSVRNGWFDKKDVEKTFEIDELDNTDDVILSFVARKHVGTLSIDLNGDNIYESSVETQNVEPIKLRDNRLVEGENTLKFSVSKVGAAFWKTNEYSFENTKVIGDITDISKQKTKNIFTIEPWKYNNLERATLKFDPDCNQRNVGILDVYVNDVTIFSGIPDCGMLNKYEVPVGTLNAGINDVVFTTMEGIYLVDQIKVDLELEELTSPLYWFEITDDEMENITKGLIDINLSLEFVDDDEDKILDINVNGHMRRVDQDEADYEKQINSWVEEGRNYIKLIPKKTVDIVTLTIEMIELDEDDEE
jgi:hypothetical protein